MRNQDYFPHIHCFISDPEGEVLLVSEESIALLLEGLDVDEGVHFYLLKANNSISCRLLKFQDNYKLICPRRTSYVAKDKVKQVLLDIANSLPLKAYDS